MIKLRVSVVVGALSTLWFSQEDIQELLSDNTLVAAVKECIEDDITAFWEEAEIKVQALERCEECQGKGKQTGMICGGKIWAEIKCPYCEGKGWFDVLCEKSV